jgi:hypothetical protein
MALTVKEAHIALAAAIQDPIYGDAVIDGARFSASLRNVYLYRAMMKIQSGILMQIAPLPREQGNTVLFNILPYMETTKNIGQMNYLQSSNANELEYFFSAGDEDPNSQYAGTFINMAKPMFFTLRRDIEEYPESKSAVDTIKVPIVRYSEYIEKVSAKHLQVSDPIATFIGTEAPVTSVGETYPTLVFKIFTANIYNAAMQYIHSNKSTLHYIRYPNKPDYINGPDLNLDFEPAYYEQILREAAIMAFLDSDDILNVEILQGLMR